jgi:hypothetical protein
MQTMNDSRAGRPGASTSGIRQRRIGAVAIAMLAFACGACSSDSGSAATTTAAPGTVGSAVSGGAASASSDPTDVAGSTVPTVVDEATTTTVAPTTTTTIPPTTTTTIPLVTAGAIVLVANAAGIPGAAGQLTAALQAVGFSTKQPTDAAGYEESLDASKIYFLPDAEPAARSLAAVMQINSVARMPTPAPIVDAQVGLSDATVLVMLGHDLAGKEIPGFAGR